MRITLNRNWLFVPLAAILIAVGGMLTARLPTLLPTTAPPATDGALPSGDPSEPAQAAARFLRTFYALDYHQRERWLAALKPLSSADGYTLLHNLIAPALWKDLERTRTVVTADQVGVEDGGLTAQGVSKLIGNTPWQIRRATIVLAPQAKWPGWNSQRYTTHILLSREADGWKFVMLLSDDQAKIFEAQPKGDQ